MIICRTPHFVSNILNAIISDEENPTLSNLPNSTTVSSKTGKDYAVVNWTEPTTTDNSGEVTVSSSRKPESQFYLGTTRVKYAAVDPSGNTAEYTFNVTVTGQ